MALHFILGGSGSGKSGYIYEHILRQSKEEPQQLFFVVVPEQFTLQTQRELVSRQENRGILNIDVVSFLRLAYRIFDELGARELSALNETGKLLLLRKIAQEEQDSLTVLKGKVKRPGYLNELKSTLSELSQYGVGPAQLTKLAEEEDLPLGLQGRLKDLALLYRQFQEYIAGKNITDDELLTILAQRACESKLLSQAVFVLDGFTGFTPIQNHLIEELLLCGKEVYVTVTLDPREDAFTPLREEELFYLSKKTIQTLVGLAKKHGVPVAEPVWLSDGALCRHSGSPALAHLEKHLFRSNPQQYGENPGTEISLSGLSNPRQEIAHVAGEITRLVRERGYCYREIGVVCGDIATYDPYVGEIFDAFQIPYFLDQKTPLGYQPFSRLLLALLSMAEQDYSYDSVMNYLRSGLSGVSMEETDPLENYLLANGIRGKKQWEENWLRRRGLEYTEELTQLNGLREKILRETWPVMEVLASKETTVREKSLALYDFLSRKKVQQALMERGEILEAEGRTSLARAYEQLYRVGMDLLDQMVELLGQEKMTTTEYRQILEAGLSTLTIGITPPGFDTVLVGDLQRSRLPQVKALFLIGANDGLIPKTGDAAGFLSQQDREELLRHQVELAPGSRQKTFIQRFYLYLTLTKPSERLYLSYYRADGNGAEARKSYLIGVMELLFPELSTNAIQNLGKEHRLFTGESSLSFFLDELSLVGQNQESEDFYALLQWYRQREEWKEPIYKLVEASLYRYEKTKLSPEIIRQLYGAVLENSVTRLEEFSKCAFSHFMKYGLRLREREDFQLEASDLGQIFHDALEHFSWDMEEQGYDWNTIPKEKEEELLEAAVEAATEGHQPQLYYDARSAYNVNRVRRILRKTVETLGNQFANSRFRPEGYEVDFYLEQEGELTLRLKGRIDRMDTCHKDEVVEVRVVDYKSSKKDFSLERLYHGLMLQLVVYMNAAEVILKEKYPDQEIVPAGMFYYHLDDPVIDLKKPATPAEVRGMQEKELLLKGVSGGTPEECTGKRAMNRQQMETVLAYGNWKLRELATSIAGGEIGAEPYVIKEENGCTYCPYHGVCGFDGKLPGFGGRELEPMSEEELLEALSKKVRGEEEPWQ